MSGPAIDAASLPPDLAAKRGGTGLASRVPWLVPAFVALAFGVLAMRPILTPDLWWHLAMGREALAAGARVFADPISVHAERPFVANEWLFEVVLYGVHALGGLVAVQLLVGLIGAATFLVALALARRLAGAAGGWTALAAAVVTVAPAELRLSPRPHAVGQLFVVLVYLLAWESARSVGRRGLGAALALVAVALVWSQTHGSVFIAPAIAVFASLSGSWPGRRHVVALGAVASSTLLGADGWRLWSRVLLHRGGEINRQVGEMQPFTLEEWLHPSPFLFFAELAAALAVAGSLRRRAWSPGPVLASALGLAMTLGSNRFAAEWGLLTLPWLATVWRLDPGEEALGRRWVAVAGVALVLAFSSPYGAPSLEVGPGVPAGPSRALAALDVRGAVFDAYDDGGYLAWQGDGRLRVLVDSRARPFYDTEELWAAAAALSQPGIFAALDRAHGFEAVVVARRRPLCGALEAGSEWRPVWFSERDAVFLRGTGEKRLISACREALPIAECRAGGEVKVYLREVNAMLALTPEEAYLGRLGAALALQCGGDVELPLAGAYLEGAAAFEPAHPDRAWLLALAQVRRGDPAATLAALDLAPIDERAEHLRLAALRRLERSAEVVALGRARWERAAATPGDLADTVAWACEREGDLDCAARMALRAALQGDEEGRGRLADLLGRGAVPPSLRPLAEAAVVGAEADAQPSAER